jgi:hypothetical protein
MSLALADLVHWLLALALTWIAAPPPGAVTGLAEREGRVIAGSPLGLFAWGAAGWERTPVAGAVFDLAAAPDGLWIATNRALWFWEPRGEPREVPLGAGARLRGVAVDALGQVWVASESGLFVRRAGEDDFERDSSLPPGDVLALRAAGTAIFAARSNALWMRRRDRFEALAIGLGEGWWELRAAATWRGAVYLAVPQGLWRVAADSAERIDPGLGELRDVQAAESGLWLATSRGVWRFEAPPSPALTLPDPVLDASTTRLLAQGERLLAATDRGVAALGAPDLAARGAAPASRPAAAPDVAAVHAAALAYLDLGPEGLREAEQRARGRGWLPLLRASAGVGRDHARDYDRDEVFTSGELHSLYDTHYARDHGFAADVELVWDLDQLASPDDAIAVSRERRLVVELRDQVLERVNRLYFERLRSSDALAAEADAAKQRELELRVAELTAQLDAWTGGRFSRLLHDSPPIDRREP